MAHFYRQISTGAKKRIEDPHMAGEILTIIGGLHMAEDSHSLHNKYANEARNLPQTLVHKADKQLTRNTRQGPEDIVFTEADTKWVHYPYTDILVITVGMANSNVHRMLVDNGSAIDVLYWDAYKKTCLIESDLSPTTSSLYRFTGDHVIPRGTIKPVVTVGGHPRTSTMVTKFLVVDCSSAFNRVIGRSLLKALWAVTSIHNLTKKFTIAMGTRKVRGRQYHSREC